MKIGIMGSGQLGWMLIMEGRKFGFEFNVFDESKGPAARIADHFYGPEEAGEFIRESDVVTFEFENVPMETLELADSENKLRPGLESIRIKKRRSREKRFLNDKGFPVAKFRTAESFWNALEIATEFGNAVIKTSESGYDGKGQVVVRDGVLQGEPLPDQEFVVEKYVNFVYECSVISTRDVSGRIFSFPPSLNYNYMGKLRNSYSPIRADRPGEIAARLLTELDYVGTMGIEFFYDGRNFLINEFAPRVHNGGHHTLMGFSASQFSQHILAVAGYPISQPRQYIPAGIVNVVGIDINEELTRNIQSVPESMVYNYGKPARRGRKVGHVNLTDRSLEGLKEKIGMVENIIYAGSPESFF